MWLIVNVTLCVIWWRCGQTICTRVLILLLDIIDSPLHIYWIAAVNVLCIILTLNGETSVAVTFSTSYLTCVRFHHITCKLQRGKGQTKSRQKDRCSCRQNISWINCAQSAERFRCQLQRRLKTLNILCIFLILRFS